MWTGIMPLRKPLDFPLPVERREYLLVTEQTEIGIMHLLDSAQGPAQLKRECSL